MISTFSYRYGPLVHFWTMRFEAKHKYFKRLTAAVGNFINLPYTLAMRHQFLQCHLRLESSEDLNIVEVGKGNFSIIEVEKVMMNDSNPLGIDVTTSDLDYLINLQGNKIYWYDMYIKQCVYMLCLLSHIGYRLYVQCTYVYMCISKIILCTLICTQCV